MKCMSGRRVFRAAVKPGREARVERSEVQMLAQVTAIPVRTRDAERLRFPWQWQSAKG